MGRFGMFIPWIVAPLAFALLTAHTLGWSALTIDGTTLALPGLIAIAPLLEYVRKIKLGDFEAEIDPREVAAVTRNVEMGTHDRDQTSAKISSFEDEIVSLVREGA
jgi:hypothetical protein